MTRSIHQNRTRINISGPLFAIMGCVYLANYYRQSHPPPRCLESSLLQNPVFFSSCILPLWFASEGVGGRVSKTPANNPIIKTSNFETTLISGNSFAVPGNGRSRSKLFLYFGLSASLEPSPSNCFFNVSFKLGVRCGRRGEFPLNGSSVCMFKPFIEGVDSVKRRRC